MIHLTAFSIVIVLGLGHPAATQFKHITLSAPASSEARCSMEGGYLAEKDTRIKALERHGWRVIMWDCKAGADS